MNTNDPPSSEGKQNPMQSSEQSFNQSATPKTPPLSSPHEPTRAYPADPSRTYSSDPSQYAYPPNKPSSEEPSKIYTTEPLDTARIAREDKRTSNNEQASKAFENKSQQTRQSGNSQGEMYQYMTTHREQVIAYILSILGLLLMLFANRLLGGIIIGMVTGYYFAPEIIYYLRNLSQITGHLDQLRCIVLAALALGLFIAAPGIFIGAIAVASFKQVMSGPQG